MFDRFGDDVSTIQTVMINNQDGYCKIYCGCKLKSISTSILASIYAKHARNEMQHKEKEAAVVVFEQTIKWEQFIDVFIKHASTLKQILREAQF